MTRRCLALCLLGLALTLSSTQEIKILTNHIGYEAKGPKHAVIQGDISDYIQGTRLIGFDGARTLMLGQPRKIGRVAKWKSRCFWTLDFDAADTEGTYVIECRTNRGIVHSFPFHIQKNLLERQALANVITAGLEDEEDIDFHPTYVQTGADDDWRWSEQWLPHAAWFPLAISADHS